MVALAFWADYEKIVDLSPVKPTHCVLTARLHQIPLSPDFTLGRQIRIELDESQVIQIRANLATWLRAVRRRR